MKDQALKTRVQANRLAHVGGCAVRTFAELKILFELQLASNDHRVTLRMAEIHDQFDTILILDFGSQVSDSLMTRKLG